MSIYMSGDELARFLHISKRKMRYFLQNGYIPMCDTGKKTHRYKIKKEDAEKFLNKTKNDPDFLTQINKMFSSNIKNNEKVVNKSTKSNGKEFAKFLKTKWAKLPEALNSGDVAKLIGYDRRKIIELCKLGVLNGVTVKQKWICTKQSLIDFCSSESMMEKTKNTPEYIALINEYIKR